MQVDVCLGLSGFQVNISSMVHYTCLDNATSHEIGGCNIVPEWCQLEAFRPYENCSIVTYQGATCQKRLPCGQQEGYKGPFEYVVPSGTDWDTGLWQPCGAYKYGSNSYFPDDSSLQLSVCKWQDDVNTYLTEIGAKNITWCRLSACDEDTPSNAAVCMGIFQFGLNNVPSGYIYNSPYPDDQDDMSLMYPNQNAPPPTEQLVTVTGDTPDTIPSGSASF